MTSAFVSAKILELPIDISCSKFFTATPAVTQIPTTATLLPRQVGGTISGEVRSTLLLQFIVECRLVVSYCRAGV